MERSEPALVPEWLRSSGSVTSSGSSTHHSALSSSHSDTPSSTHQARNRSSRGRSDANSPRSSFLDRSSSSNSRRSSNNGSAKHAYSSFSRSHRDKDRERDKDRFSYLDPWDHNSTAPLGSILGSREKDGLRHTFSLPSRRQGELFPHRDLKNGGHGSNGNGILCGPTSTGTGIQKTVLSKDFPSLVSEDRLGMPDVSRVLSPGLSCAVQSLPIGNSALIGGEGWTSALAEVPSVIGNSNMGSSSSIQTATAQTGGSGIPSATSGLNMAEALVQSPSQARSPPQVSVKTQRREEMAIKQSRQLIPVTPSMPKALVLGSTDKSKIKTVARTVDVNLASSKSSQQQPSLSPHASHSLPGGQIKPDSSKTSQGKLLVLKPSRENSVSSSLKDFASPTSSADDRASNNQLSYPPSLAGAPARSSNSPREFKSASSMVSGLTLEKRPTLSQAQSRNAFFKLLKQKSSKNMPTDLPGSGCSDSSSASEKPEVSKEAINALSSAHAILNGMEVANNGDAGEGVEQLCHDEEEDLSCEAAWYPSEEEAAFLRSLGWEENYDEDEGLTKEEIDAFVDKYTKLKPSLKVCQGVLPKLQDIRETSDNGASYKSISESNA